MQRGSTTVQLSLFDPAVDSAAGGLGAKCPDKSRPKPQNVTRFLAFTPPAAGPPGPGASPAAVAQAPAAPGSAPAQDEKITVNFVNADIQSVIKTVGQHTGRNFILDPRVQGTVNIVSDRPVSKDMLYQILLSTLRVQGYAAVEDERLREDRARGRGQDQRGPHGRARRARPRGDRIVTQVFILQNENAVQLVPVLRPLVTANNFIAAYPNNNAIVITDYAEQRAAHPAHHRVDRPALGRRGADPAAAERLGDRHRADAAARGARDRAPRPTRPARSRRRRSPWTPRTNSLIVRADNPRS